MAQKINIVIDQGTTFASSFNLRDTGGNALDLTEFTGESQMRKHYTSSTAYAFGLQLSNDGVVTLTMANTVTSTITPGRYVYDIRLVDTANNVSRVIEGVVTVTPSVTR